MHRTTIMLDTELYRAVKRKAVDEGQPMRRVVEEALKAYLGAKRQHVKTQRLKFGVYRARVRGTLSRRELYEDYLTHKVG